MNYLDYAVLINIGAAALNIYATYLSVRSRTRLEQIIEAITKLKIFYENKIRELSRS